jgi:hypothetical protein
MRTWVNVFVLVVLCTAWVPVRCWAGEQTIVLRDYLQEQWRSELLHYPFSAEQGACDARSVTLAGPRGPVPVQLTAITYWPNTRQVKSAQLAFIADLDPLAANTYAVRYGATPVTPVATDLTVAAEENRVEITTRQFGARLLLGERTYPEPVSAADVPGPVIGMRLADGAWFGGSALYGPAKIAAYSATLTDNGPVFARVLVRYTYANGNTMALSLRIAAGDNTMRMETSVAKDQPKDGFTLALSRGLPPLIFQVQDEMRRDRDQFLDPKSSSPLAWAEIPLTDYVAPKPQPANLVTKLSPWEDWFGTFTQTRIRFKLQNTTRELQIRSLDPGAWVEPRAVEAIFDPALDPDPAKGMWVSWGNKCLPVLREANGEIVLQVNAAQGVRKWTVSDCLSMPGVAASFYYYGYKPESAFPPETRPTINYRLDEVKDYVLTWPDKPAQHPRLYITRPELEARWQRQDADPAQLAELLKYGALASDNQIFYTPNWSTDCALGAYLLSGGSPEVAEKTRILARLRQALNYDLWGMQFGAAGAPTPILYDAIIDSPLVSAEERPVLRARMAYYAYRLADPAVWSAERGYCSGNQNMTVTWEISRGLTACAIPEHPMAREWYGKAERLTEQFLGNMVGEAGEWPEAMSHHGLTSVNMLLAFAIASSNSGLHDYVNDPRVKRMVLAWAKMLLPRDPRPRGINNATPNRRIYPAMGRDSIGVAGATTGAMARVMRAIDPAYSADLQWAWLEEGASGNMGHMGGFAYIACDKRLPAKTPVWTSEVLPRTGAVLRHGLGTADEHQVMLYSGDHFAAFYTGHTGSFPSIFAYGVPVAGTFPGGYEYQENFLVNTVDIARPLGSIEDRTACYGYHGCPTEASAWSWGKGQTARFGEHGGLANVSAFSALPRQDYAAVDVARHYPRRLVLNWRTNLPAWAPVPERGKPPVDWRRQTLFLKDDAPAQPAYLIIRDSVKGGQPTVWQMWTVSETLDTPEQLQDVAAVLANKPGQKILPARELKGDRFTAIGQFGVDVEYYIAAPTGTPRHTLRWGTDMFDWANKLMHPEYQDLLHLQMPDDGAYFVAFFPRKRGLPAPAFSTLGEGTIIKVKGVFGTDYGFLSATEATATGESAVFNGTAASVQDRASGLVLSLGASGSVRYKAYRLAADVPASLRVKEKELTVALPAGIQPPAFELQQPFPGATLTLNAPGAWKLAKRAPGVTLERKTDGYLLRVPAGCKAVTLVR